jgi:8-oxo-dGTP diphosphatase
MMTKPLPSSPEWAAHQAKSVAKQARKRVAGSVLLRDSAGRILVIDPVDTPTWDIPGGPALANEAPDDAAARRLRKALDLDLLPGRLLCIDWIPPQGPLDDQLVFVFDGGMVKDQLAAVVRPYGSGVAACRFVETGEVSSMLDPDVWLRVQHSISAFVSGTTAYLHYGLRLSGAPSDITA